MPALAHTLAIHGVSVEMHVHSFEGHEGLSELFSFDVTVGVAAGDALVLADVVRKQATLTIWRTEGGSEESRSVHGRVCRVEVSEPERNRLTYHIRIVPWAWLLQHRRDSRIFQSLNVPQILQHVFEGAGFTAGTDFRISVQRTYTEREYCVQYRESDWDFACRLMEEEGIYYRFEQGEGGCLLVLGDARSEPPPIDGDSTIPFRPPLGAFVGVDDTVAHFALSEEVRAGKVTLRDWNFEKPTLALDGTGTDEVFSDLEVYDYPGDYQESSAQGTALAKTRLEELQAAGVTGSGDSGCVRIVAGHKFTLAEHPQDSLNVEYLVTRVEHQGTEPLIEDAGQELPPPPRYTNRFDVMPASSVFRPPRVTRRPTIQGVQTAIVVGPPKEEIYTDNHGRVKVQFHWDRLGKKDDKSSCWIRVAQMWAGSAFGALFLPRVNDEVVVSFLEGDPDRPLVVGSVYHGTNVPPYSLPSEKTKSTIKTQTSPNGGGSNELRFEDKKGSEEVYLHGQKDWTISVENDKNQKLGHDETLEVGHDRTKTVKHDQTATVDNDDILTVKHDQTVEVQNDQTLTVKHDRTVTVDGDHTETVKGKQSMSVTGAQSLDVGGDQKAEVKGSRSLTVTEDVTETFRAKLAVTVSGDMAEKVGGKRAEKVDGDRTVEVQGKQTVTITGDSVESVSGKKSIKVTGDVTIEAGSSTVTIAPSGAITIKGVNVKVDASGPLELHGATFTVNSDGPAKLKAPMVNVESDAMSQLKGQILVLDGQVIKLG
jgi:type VI secretion system secreted protein VgrG